VASQEVLVEIWLPESDTLYECFNNVDVVADPAFVED